ncbi:MAG: asparagine synthase (glutamine-hydrolyzing) [Alphaproteobacteria bacterium]|nr:asparagine synthase (glutamine-hydrolyzing) [Alphaproteobacteria bacterium]
MCGIAGIMTRNGSAPARATLERLSKALAHRGPDGEAVYAVGDVGLVHLRLAIIDLATGDQPIIDETGAALVANGEIYNYVELRAAMADERFATRSDCEPPLKLYRRDGAAFTAGLRGMYAVAIYDLGLRRLVLARDPFGIKPLYYVEDANGFAFASEAQALIAAGLVAPRVRDDRRAELLELQFTTGHETILDGIRRVEPGETLVVAGGRVIERRRRAALAAGPPVEIGEEDALAALDRALLDSVAVHQRADVPYAMFLSGGIDSAAVLAAMARLNDRPVLAFTAGFADDSVADERAAARAVATALGARHVERTIEAAEFWSVLPAIAAAMDDPAADYAIVPTWILAREAAREVKVVLTGEGGDELFGGYGRYRSAMRPWWRGGRAMRARGLLDGLGVLRREPPGWRDGIVASEHRLAVGGRTRLQIAQAVDCADWLPNDLLLKLDRCLMAHALEGRTPLLDPVLAEIVFRLPDGLKVRGRTGKWLLRRWLADRVPAADAFGRKRGFSVPVAAWIAAAGARLGPLVAQQPGIAEICAPEAVQRLYTSAGKHVGMAAWVLLFYALWHRRHVLGLAPAGDVFDCLAASAARPGA